MLTFTHDNKTYEIIDLRTPCKGDMFWFGWVGHAEFDYTHTKHPILREIKPRRWVFEETPDSAAATHYLDLGKRIAPLLPKRETPQRGATFFCLIEKPDNAS